MGTAIDQKRKSELLLNNSFQYFEPSELSLEDSLRFFEQREFVLENSRG